MTNYANVATIINARGHVYTPVTAEECRKHATDYDGWQVTAVEQDAWLAGASDEEIAVWLESHFICAQSVS